MTIFLLEDDPLFAETIIDFLEEEGVDVLLAASIKEGIDICASNTYDLMMLDLNLGDGQGDLFLREMRDSGNDRPALFLTSSVESERALSCFDAGADDYIRKPCDLNELLARLKGLMRRYYKSVETAIDLGEGWRFEPSTKRLLHHETERDLHAKERQLLGLLIRERGRVVSFETISETLWGIEGEPSFGALRVYVNNLKKILGSERIVNIRGEGYKLV